jgi:mRNA-degrading endonuclease toxin of MazEF toxin-antitoxin module
MATALRLGQIVWAELADANGIRKSRPAVIVTPTDRITEGGQLEVVAITSRLSDPLPEDHVPLPWHARGHPRTGLNRRCAAVCNWVSRILPGDIQQVAGFVPAAPLLAILSRIAASTPSPPAPPTGAEGTPPGASLPTSDNGS